MTTLLGPMLDFALPPRCPSCGLIIPQAGSFCGDCWGKLRFIAPPCCNSCGLPLPFESEEQQDCAACLARPPLHNGIHAAVAYCDISRSIALKLKYGGKIGLADMIAAQLVRHLPESREDHLLVPVPLHWTRLWARSFNQSALIASSLAKLSGIPCAVDLLQRRKRTELLRGKTARERKKEVAKAFALQRRWEGMLDGKHILLVDDVYTSGATSDACVKLLKKQKAASVKILCWARVLRDENMHT